jgi:hypothetical protein
MYLGLVPGFREISSIIQQGTKKNRTREKNNRSICFVKNRTIKKYFDKM